MRSSVRSRKRSSSRSSSRRTMTGFDSVSFVPTRPNTKRQKQNRKTKVPKEEGKKKKGILRGRKVRKRFILNSLRGTGHPFDLRFRIVFVEKQKERDGTQKKNKVKKRVSNGTNRRVQGLDPPFLRYLSHARVLVGVVSDKREALRATHDEDRGGWTGGSLPPSQGIRDPLLRFRSGVGSVPLSTSSKGSDLKKKHDNAVRTDDGRERITSRWSGRRGISWREEGEEIIQVSKRHEERIVFTSNDRARILGGTNPWVERRNVPNRVGCPTGTTRVEGFVPVRWEHEAKRHVSKEIIQEDQKRGSFRKRDRCRER